MKKSLLTAAVLVGISSAAAMAGTMYVNNDGLGQVLLYPYYNVNDGFDTGFTVTNTTNAYRAVKVRIVEGTNSWEVFDFNLYLTPNDVWTGVIHKVDDKIIVQTSDNSCTLPDLPKVGTGSEFELRSYNITDFEKGQFKARDGKGLIGSNYTGERYTPEHLLARMSEGYIEVIDMGEVLNPANVGEHKDYYASVLGIADWESGGDVVKDQNALIAGITHEKDVPVDCTQLKAFDKKYWNATGNYDLGIINDGRAPLSGTAYLTNVQQGLSGGYNAVAIGGFIDGDDQDVKREAAGDEGGIKAPKTLHNAPSSSYPNLNGQVQRAGILPEGIYYVAGLADNVSVYAGDEFKELSNIGAAFKKINTTVPEEAARVDNSADANPAAVSLSAVLMASEVQGEYFVHPATASATSWVITMPTKHFFTNTNTSQVDGKNRGVGQFGFVENTDSNKSFKAINPFSYSAYAISTPLLEQVDVVYYNREANSKAVDAHIDISPSRGAEKVGLDSEANVINWSDAKVRKLFTTINGFTAQTDFKSGWATVKFNNSKNELGTEPSKAEGDVADKYLGTCAKDANATCLKGLPVIGISATKFVNGHVGGVLSNYMYITELNYKRDNKVQP